MKSCLIRKIIDLENLLQRRSRNYPITLEEAKEMELFFRHRVFSIHPVKTRKEIKGRGIGPK